MSIRHYLENEKKIHQPLADSIYKRLQRDILTGKFKDGDKLTEKNICNEYETSRTPVRDALKQLESEDLVEMIPNRGAFVTGLSNQDIHDLLYMQFSMELLGIRWTCQRITDEELNKLSETFDFMIFYTKKNDIAKLVNIDFAFHRIIYEATHNRMLTNKLENMQTYIHHTVPKNYFAPGCLTDTLREHGNIYDSIKMRDPDSGQIAMREHLIRESERYGTHLNLQFF